MKVIFLDIDGVLNNNRTLAKCPSGFTGINNTLLSRLRKIVKETNAKIVLTSTWKDEWNKDPLLYTEDGKYLVRKFRQKGLFIYDKVKDISKYNSSYRGWSIMKYINDHNDIDRWIVIDDNLFEFCVYPEIMDRFIKTRPAIGLTNDDVVKAIELLNGEQLCLV